MPYSKQTRRRKWKARRLAGQCMWGACKCAALPGMSYCNRHLAGARFIQRTSKSKSVTLRRAAGLCIISACKNLPINDRTKCAHHLKRASESVMRYHKSSKGRAARQTYRATIRQRVFEGKWCRCCGECNPIFLTLDHITPAGNKLARRRSTTSALYDYVGRYGIPKGIQVLCYNCNCAKKTRDHCPHEDEVRAILRVA